MNKDKSNKIVELRIKKGYKIGIFDYYTDKSVHRSPHKFSFQKNAQKCFVLKSVNPVGQKKSN